MSTSAAAAALNEMEHLDREQLGELAPLHQWLMKQRADPDTLFVRLWAREEWDAAVNAAIMNRWALARAEAEDGQHRS